MTLTSRITALLGVVLVSAPLNARAQDIPAEYQQVVKTLGTQGDLKDKVLKVNIPL